MISIPIWFFVILSVFAGITILSFIFVCSMFLIGWIISMVKEKKELEPYYENPDDNPEYIPTENN